MQHRLFPHLTLAAALVLILAQAAHAAPRKTYKVHNIDVGQGSATLVQTLGGKNILFDTGWDFAGDRMVSYLRQIKVKRIDALVISHRHMDHIGGVQKLAAAVKVKKVIGPWHKDSVPESAMVHLAHLRKDLHKPHSTRNRPAYETATMGKVFDFGNGFSMETLWPKVHSSRKRIGDYNQESVAMRVVQKSPNGKAATFMFGGDLGVKEERWLARKMPQKLKCDWVVANHHGSGGSSQREFMAALDGGYSRMLRALIEGPTTKDQRFYKIAEKLKEGGRGRYASTLMRQLDPLNTNPRPIRAKWLRQLVKDVKELDAVQPSMKGRYAIYSVGKNAYGHPNATRMSEALLAGFTPITTWTNGTVVMSRKVGTDGGWTRDWKPSASSSRALPKVKVPGWLGRSDPEKPYNDVRREANYHWSKQNPHREIPWNAPWDTTKTWRTTSREFSQGRKDWVEQYVAAKSMAATGVKDGRQPRTQAEKRRNMTAGKRKLTSMQYKSKREWHGLKLDNMNELTKQQLRNVALKADGRFRPNSRKGDSSKLDPVASASIRGKHSKSTTSAGGRKTQGKGSRWAQMAKSTSRAKAGSRKTTTRRTTRPRTRTTTKARVKAKPRTTTRRKAATTRTSTSQKRASTSRTRAKTRPRTRTTSTKSRPRARTASTSRTRKVSTGSTTRRKPTRSPSRRRTTRR